MRPDADAPWRPSRVRMARYDPDRVAPRRGTGGAARPWRPASASPSRSRRGASGCWPSRRPACCGGGSGDCVPAPGCGPAGWPGSGATCPGLLWVRSFTLAGAMVLIAPRGAVRGRGLPRRPPRAGGGPGPGLPGRHDPGRGGPPDVAVRRASPSAGSSSARPTGPLLGVARLGGPLGLTAAVYVGGVAVGAAATAAVRAGRGRRRVTAFDRAHPRRRRRSGPGAGPWPGSGTLAVTAVVALAVVAVTGAAAAHAPDGGPPVGTVTAAAVQGGGVRGFSKSQVDPATVLARRRGGHRTRCVPPHGTDRPELVLWPEDVVSLPDPLPGRPRGGGAVPPGRGPARHPGGRGDRDGLRHGLPQRGGGLRTRRRAGRPLREGPPGALRRVRPLPLVLRPPGQPVGRAARRRARTRHRVCSPRRPAGSGR